MTTVRDPRELGGDWRHHQHHAVHEPDAGLAPFVARLWSASWDYPEPYRQKIVPMPGVHVTVRPGAAPVVVGPPSRHVVRELTGRGRVVGVAFRPAAFRVVAGEPMSRLVDRTLPAAELPGLAGKPRWGADDDPDVLSRWLAGHLPVDPGPAAREAGELVDLVAADPTIARVDRLAAASGLGLRHLQRIFAEHVGLGPKWVIRRYRLQEVVHRLDAGERVDWADLAAELGFVDQQHLARDFGAVFGEPPTWYARRYRAG